MSTAGSVGALDFARTGLGTRSRFSAAESRSTTRPASASGVQVLAEIPNLFGRGDTAQMSYYETRSGAKVFAAGAFYLTRLLPRDAVVSRILDNLCARQAND